MCVVKVGALLEIAYRKGIVLIFDFKSNWDNRSSAFLDIKSIITLIIIKTVYK